MKVSKIIILSALIGLSILSFLVLLFLYKIDICVLTQNIFISILTSTIVAIPSAIIYIFKSNINTSNKISLLYYRVFLICRDKIAIINTLSNKEILELNQELSNITEKIGKTREGRIYASKYNNDDLTVLVTNLIRYLSEYTKVSKQKKTNLKHIIEKTNTDTINLICKIEELTRD